MKLRFWQGLWRLADPKISTASFASIFLGTCAAASDGLISYPWLLATVLGVFAIEVAKNASGEIFDFNTGNDQAVHPDDRSPFSGGKRVLVDGILTKRQTAGIALVFYLIGMIAGLAIVLWREPWILFHGLIGAGLAIFYHAPPIKLAYRGLGELAVALAYGPLIATGTYLVQRQEITPGIVLISILLGLLIGGFLLINEFPDFKADQLAHKNTLVVRLGRQRASRLYATIMTCTFLALLCLPFIGLPFTIWLGLASAMPAYSSAAHLMKHFETTRLIIPAQAQSLRTFILFALGTGIGYFLG